MIRLLVCAALVCMTTAVQMKCGTTFYDSQWNQCCSGIICPRKGANSQCCGSTAFDPTTHMCCRGKVSHKSVNVMECCGREVYNPAEESCDPATLRISPWTAERCGRYDTNKFLCCDTIRVPKDAGIRGCCGPNGLNPDTHLCCSIVHYKDDHSVESIKYSVAQKPPGAQNHAACCHDQAYDPTHNLCCGGKVLRKKDVNSDCCGYELMDARTQICCKGKPQVKGNNHYACCADRAYDSDKYICCDKTIQEKISGKTNGCCGEAVYDVDHDICCGGAVQPKPSGSYSCCGQRSYDVNFYHCAGGEPHKRGKYTTVCENKVIDLSEGVVCSKSGKIVAAPKHKNKIKH